ncbi:hypothetical protein RRG08_032382 [Elysia crispata]|uniref:Uncharacterized protein n=1 Tax=Elysia crispata TaxID=231223 RepID=A0AAE1DY72_9GAST|nr:hypothetical protein RRG08_032382 [Elysia crispata]
MRKGGPGFGSHQSNLVPDKKENIRNVETEMYRAPEGPTNLERRGSNPNSTWRDPPLQARLSHLTASPPGAQDPSCSDSEVQLRRDELFLRSLPDTQLSKLLTTGQARRGSLKLV